MAKHGLFVDPDEDFSPSQKKRGPFIEDSSPEPLSDCEERQADDDRSDEGSNIVLAEPDLPLDDDEDEDCFCLCRGPDEGWMVCCDKCEEWYHGDCVDLVKEEDEDLLILYACPVCTAQGKAESVWKRGWAEERFEARRALNIERKAMERKKRLEKVSAERNRNDEKVLAARIRLGLLEDPEDNQIVAEVIFEDPVFIGDTNMTEDLLEGVEDEMEIDRSTPVPMEIDEKEGGGAQALEDDGEEKAGVKEDVQDIEQTKVFDLVQKAMVSALFGEKA